MVIRAPKFVAHKGFEDQNPHQGLAMTRRYDTITQLRYVLKVIVPLPFATMSPWPSSALATNLVQAAQRLVIQMQQWHGEGLPTSARKRRPGKVCPGFGSELQVGTQQVRQTGRGPVA
jgi:hypothetical protein